MPLCVNVKTETEVRYAFYRVHCYGGADARFRPGSDYELVASAGRRSAG
jgi:hypothetical protein